MKQGSIDISFFLLAFICLQIWWLFLTIKNSEKEFLSPSKDKLNKIKEQLEKDFEK